MPSGWQSWDVGSPEELLQEHLDVYDTRDGPWNPDHGEIEIPEDWDLLPAGDAFVTRTVKAAGVYWTAWKPRTRQRPHRRIIGVWAPRSTIEAARAAAEATDETRARQRKQGEAHRQRREDSYQAELRSAILAFLDFDEAHRSLADHIAHDASARAAVVGSGRVGRTRKLTLDERAALAARAFIRHRLTTYEDDLAEQVVWDDDFLYREVKAAAQQAVDDFLAEHRLKRA